MPDRPAPKSGLLLMAIILVVLAFVAIHANVQKLRRDKIETVTVKPLEMPVNSGSASPSPTAP